MKDIKGILSLMLVMVIVLLLNILFAALFSTTTGFVGGILQMTVVFVEVVIAGISVPRIFSR